MNARIAPYELRVPQGHVPYVPVVVRGLHGTAQGGVGVLDTGAAYTMASTQRFAAQFANSRTVAKPLPIMTANGPRTTGPGHELTLSICLERARKKFDLTIQATVWENPGLVADRRMDILLGCDFLSKAKFAFLGRFFAGGDHKVHFHAVGLDGWNIVERP